MNHQISKQRPASPQSVTADFQTNNMINTELHREKHVRFTSLVEVNVFDRIDPALKADLYYSKEEMYFIQKRYQIAASLRRQLMNSKKLQQKFKESKVYADYLKQKSESNDRKRLLDQSSREPVLVTKRRRTQ